uniref:Glycine cleavage system P protein n=1 Tax=Stygiella incarcerata TaxID=1712417 RepID=A0A192ZIQ2_9EUKA|nr:glycine cleavage system P protein [Stygiella incarcerata]|eukprot:TRINITY_DN82224_c0_g1_i1.p1 TRINITY_DN82224_c0_g1~~TRINITY_DN82224_c0_g1_i1.p1  ORF type:complete len:988 (-),score=227.68 TRINITY_DN82224_c0_g1_i1:150-3113(-)
MLSTLFPNGGLRHVVAASVSKLRIPRWLVSAAKVHAVLPTDTFVDRHLGQEPAAIEKMLKAVGCSTIDELIDQVIPKSIRLQKRLNLAPPTTESEALEEFKQKVGANKVMKNFIGNGFHDALTPTVILKNVLENPCWVTSYTPYQAEISQGRLEMLLNFQQMIIDMTGLPVSNASLLDQATGAAEALLLSQRVCKKPHKGQRLQFIVSDRCNPQDIAVVQTRATAFDLDVIVADVDKVDFSAYPLLCGVMVGYPDTYGRVQPLDELAKKVHEEKAVLVAIADLIALATLKPPGEMGCDVVLGSSQRFGIPLNFGGPHAGYFATTEALKRQIPGRVIGVSKDARGRTVFRMSLQTREQHIRREKATSNICTSMSLLADLATMFAIYHGPERLTKISHRIHAMAMTLREGLRAMGLKVNEDLVYDTVTIFDVDAKAVMKTAEARGMNLRRVSDSSIAINVGEATTLVDVNGIFLLFGEPACSAEDALEAANIDIPEELKRTSKFLTHEVFNSYHTEHEMERYLYRLVGKDYSLAQGMIPLGSCTMKLNSASELVPVTMPEVCSIHPFAPPEQTEGFLDVFRELSAWLAEVTGFAGTSLQPIGGSQGEYAGLMVIRSYLQSIGEGKRDICLIPVSAHGTNPASAVMAGFRVMTVKCDKRGNVDAKDLESLLKKHGKDVACVMITYPSTHGIFETEVENIVKMIHDAGGQVYLDGANMNAQVGLCRPGDIGADVCHLNLHKTFAIPHGGGGPPSAPICVAKHLVPFLPNHPLIHTGGDKSCGAISGGPFGSSAILPITWMYMRMMGAEGLTLASKMAILSANYIKARLSKYYEIVYTDKNGFVGHEFILDIRPFKKYGIEAEDVAKRLMDYGFHAPTMSFPIANTLMIEPTESESIVELDRFVDAMISIRGEIAEVVDGKADQTDNVLKNSPHTSEDVTDAEWKHPYSREKAVFPLPSLRTNKYWPPINRVDNVYGDRNLFCSCPTWDAYH